MEYLTNIPSIVLLTLSIIALPSNKAKKALAVGCDTYYRITGQIAGCTEASTENARELWLERYSTCLEIQLSQEISIYKNKITTYYAEGRENSEPNLAFDTLTLEDNHTSSFPILLKRSVGYRGNADFCNR